MAKKEDLRLSRAGTIINVTSRVQESVLGQALTRVVARVIKDFDVKLAHDRRWLLRDLVRDLSRDFPDVDFYTPGDRSFISPDGGILTLVDEQGRKHIILITEVKNQGTNDLRSAEGQKPQAKGNAIERLGKNVIGFRAAMLREAIMPFVCFGYGIDFEDGSSILDRVATIAMFGDLNRIHLMNQGDNKQFNRGSFLFRRDAWTESEMEEILYEVASRSVYYYFAKYGVDTFQQAGRS